MLTDWTTEDKLQLHNLLRRKEILLLERAFHSRVEQARYRLEQVSPTDSVEISRQQTIIKELPRIVRSLKEELETQLKDLQS